MVESRTSGSKLQECLYTIIQESPDRSVGQIKQIIWRKHHRRISRDAVVEALLKEQRAGVVLTSGN